MDTGLTLNNVRAEILLFAINDKNVNDLQLAEITRYVFSSLYFEVFDNLLRKTIDYDKVCNTMKDQSYAMLTPKQNFN